MKLARIPLPELALLSVTRIAMGIGVGFLFAPAIDRRFARDGRMKLGALLLGVSALATIPLTVDVMRRTRRAERMFGSPEMPGMPTGRSSVRGDAMAH
jgi:hypothetical protein